jgi:antitoxin component YwqK of YwqJK toxin-antitoxin module
MIRHVILSGITILISVIANSQHSQYNTAIPGKTKLGKGVAVTGFITYDRSKYTLPKNGEVLGRFSQQLIFAGTTKRHQLDRGWQSWHSNGNRCDSGTLVKGIPHGVWKTWDAAGNLKTFRTYDAEKLKRMKAAIARNNPRIATYPLVKMHRRNPGQAEKYLQAGYSYSFTGHRGYHLSLQSSIEENITPGNEYHPVFDDCLHHGLFMNFYPGGIAKDSGYYKNGLKHGLWLHRSDDHSYTIGAYQHGTRMGDWKLYSNRGEIAGIIIYNKRGEEQWRKKIGTNKQEI